MAAASPEHAGYAGLTGPSEVRLRSQRLAIVAVLFMVPWLVLVARLWYLQVLKGDGYARIAADNFVRERDIQPDRGRILDVRGRVLAENRPSYDIYASPALLRRRPAVADKLASLLSLDDAKRRQLAAASESGKGAEILVRRDVTRDQLATVETWRNDLPGVYVQVRQRRHYPYDALGAHLLGYVSAIGQDEARQWAEYGYNGSEQVGRAGLEKTYEAVLRGAPGLLREVIDVRGAVQDDEAADALLGGHRRVEPVPGKDLVLSVDMDLMQIVDDAMARTPSGAVVALDPRDGSVLAMLSKPGFNPNAWAGRLSDEEKRRIDNDPFKPMLDKALSAYFPGSTYKVVTALAALEAGITSTSREIECPGFLHFGERNFRCWNRTGHGEVDLDAALAESCDVYFYQLGLELGIDRLARAAGELGFGEAPGTGLPTESPGLVPTRAWHEERSPGGFQHGFTVNTSVGQGDVRISPLQLALAYSALANEGSLYFPRLVDRIATPDGTSVFEFPRAARRKLPYGRANLHAVVHGLEQVLDDKDGTAHDYRLGYVEAAGKTGTAQVRALDTVRLENGEVAFADRDHAWFAAFAPAEQPRIVVAVFVEHGGHGSSAAAPVAMRVIDGYLRDVLGWSDAIDAAVIDHDGRRLAELVAHDEIVATPKATSVPEPPAFEGRTIDEASGAAP
jgi:penicillin-binding protein 2